MAVELLGRGPGEGKTFEEWLFEDECYTEWHLGGPLPPLNVYLTCGQLVNYCAEFDWVPAVQFTMTPIKICSELLIACNVVLYTSALLTLRYKSEPPYISVCLGGMW